MTGAGAAAGEGEDGHQRPRAAPMGWREELDALAAVVGGLADRARALSAKYRTNDVPARELLGDAALLGDLAAGVRRRYAEVLPAPIRRRLRWP